jgi:hypothetical protein
MSIELLRVGLSAAVLDWRPEGFFSDWFLCVWQFFVDICDVMLQDEEYRGICWLECF